MSCRSIAKDCESWRTRWDHEPAKFKADPDIAGVGVIAAFVTTAAVTLLAALAHLVLDQAWRRKTPSNVIDVRIAWLFGSVLHIDSGIVWIWNTLLLPIRYVVGWFAWSVFSAHIPKDALESASRGKWVAILETVLLNLSDQQLIVGIAMVVAGAALHCTISVYHFTIMTDLLWFTANVHLLSIISIRQYMRQNPVARNWRILMMLCLALSLAIFQFLVAHDEWNTSWPYNFQCLLNDLSGHIKGEGLMWMLINDFLIILLYGVALIQTFEGIEMLVKQWLFDIPRCRLADLQRRLASSAGLKQLLYLAVLAGSAIVLGPVILLAVLVDSECFRLAASLIWFCYGLWGFKRDRSVNPDFFDEPEEGDFGFGQITPLVLLSITLFTLGEAYFKEVQPGSHNSHSSQISLKDMQNDADRNDAAVSEANISEAEDFGDQSSQQDELSPSITSSETGSESVRSSRIGKDQGQDPERMGKTFYQRNESGG